VHTVISTFETREAALQAMNRLVDEGFDRNDIHLEDRETHASGATTRSDGTGGEHAHRGVMESIGHFFASLFGEDNHEGHSGTYSEAVRRGSSVVVVDADDETEAQRARSLMEQLGAYDVDARAQQWRSQGWTGFNPEAKDDYVSNERKDFIAGERQGIEGRDKMEVVQEELQVGKREVDKGGVRIVQRMSQKPVREIVRLREEHAQVDRRPVDRAASPEDLNAFREGTVEVREMAEVPVVGKTARVVEEVSVGKTVQEREETVEDTVRRKDVDIERIEGQGRPEVSREERAFAQRENRSVDDSRDVDELNRQTTRPIDPDKPR
jgi:uncharacterized protein (TIGR02271 family)